jgi:hypothetical protein
VCSAPSDQSNVSNSTILDSSNSFSFTPNLDQHESPVVQSQSALTQTCNKASFDSVNSAPHIKTIQLRPVEELKAPLSKDEEAYLTKLIRIKLEQSSDKQTVVCKTRGQPIILRKIVKPRKMSSFAASPLRKKRAKHLYQIRRELSGPSIADSVKQQATELKHTTKKKKTDILQQAGCRPAIITSKTALQLKARLSLTLAKQRLFRKASKALGIYMESERKEKQLQKEIMCGEIRVEHREVNICDEASNINRIVKTPLATVADLKSFVSELLDQYEEKGMLTWHENTIPENEIWVKIGGDHGGDSFKLVLQVANLKNPNSKDNSFLIRIIECKDSADNLSKILVPMKGQVSDLAEMLWKEKKIRVFLFGDYDFLLKMYGLSGAASCHPCLWCTVSKEQMQIAPSQCTFTIPRTLHCLHYDFDRNFKSGLKKTTAKVYNNVINLPIWEIEPSHVAPPYLHLLLGIVKKHHDLLEEKCHYLDTQLALSLAKETKNDLIRFRLDRTFLETVDKLRARLEKEGCEKTAVQGMKKFEPLVGPIVSELDVVLQKHKIVRQAYHGRSFIGNHCNKYLKAAVINDLTESVVTKTYKLTDNHDIHCLADDIQSKFYTLNTLYSHVHKLVSHKNPIKKDKIKDIEVAIANYMQHYRGTFSDKRVIPKQHILEKHCVTWIKTWGFGLALHGEQGGEEMHAAINRLKRRAWGLRNNEDRLRLLMKEQHILASPMLQATPPKKMKLH